MAIYGLDLYAKAFYGIDVVVRFNVQPFQALQYEHGQLQLSWTTPRQVSTPESAGKAWSTLRLVRNLYGVPATETDGLVLLEAPSTAPVETFLDLTVPVGRFAYYAIFVLTTHDAWDTTHSYSTGDQVTYSSENWIALAASQGQTPGSGAAWSTTSIATEWAFAGACVGLSVEDWAYSDFLFSTQPRAYKVNVVETTGSNPDFNLPLMQFDQVFGFAWDTIRTENDALLHINNIELTRDKFVWAMAEQMGIGNEIPDTPTLRRLRIFDATTIAQQKGSEAALETLIYDTTGWNASITAGYNLLLNMDQAAFAHPVYPTWDPNTRYQIGDIVNNAGLLYKGIIAAVNHLPGSSDLGSSPSAATPEYWYGFYAKTVGWRGMWGNTVNYVVGDAVYITGSNLFYTAVAASGPGVGAGAQTPSTSNTAYWSNSTTLTDDQSTLISLVGLWSAATAYSVAQAVYAPSPSPGDPLWVAVASQAASTNLYWILFTTPQADPANVLYNPTTGGESTWTAAAPTGSSLAVIIDGVPPSGTTPARNCLAISSNTGSAAQTKAVSVSPTLFTAWSASASYVVGQVVSYRGLNYRCILADPAGGNTPDTDRDHWAVYAPKSSEPLAIAEGVPLAYVRPWDYQQTYNQGDKVTANGNIYESIFTTTDIAPSGYRFDTRGWRWIGREATAYASSVYYQRQAPTGSTQVECDVVWYDSQDNALGTIGARPWPPLYDTFELDGPVGGTEPTYPTQAQYANPFPISWVDEGGPWRVDNGNLHTTYPAVHASGELLVMSELAYGSSPTSGDPLEWAWVTLVSQSYNTNLEQGLVFRLDPVGRTYWMLSRTRLTKNTYAADFSTVTITPVTTWTALPDNSRVGIQAQWNVGNYSGFAYTPSGTNINLFTVTGDSFSLSGHYFGVGER